MMDRWLPPDSSWCARARHTVMKNWENHLGWKCYLLMDSDRPWQSSEGKKRQICQDKGGSIATVDPGILRWTNIASLISNPSLVTATRHWAIPRSDDRWIARSPCLRPTTPQPQERKTTLVQQKLVGQGNVTLDPRAIGLGTEFAVKIAWNSSTDL